MEALPNKAITLLITVWPMYAAIAATDIKYRATNTQTLALI